MLDNAVTRESFVKRGFNLGAYVPYEFGLLLLKPRVRNHNRCDCGLLKFASFRIGKFLCNFNSKNYFFIDAFGKSEGMLHGGL